MIFLIQYDRNLGTLEKIERFSIAQRVDASKARLELELTLLKDGLNREVVLLEAESEEALRKTHNRYFRNVGDLALSGKAAIKLPNQATGKLEAESPPKSTSTD